MNLGLDRTNRGSQRGEGSGSLSRRSGDLAVKHRHTGSPKQVFGLELVDFHD